VAILIVDDNPVNAKLLVLTLKGAGFQSKVAGNGRGACDTVGHAGDTTHYHRLHDAHGSNVI
jgi:CheY-like chemotaxis protein